MWSQAWQNNWDTPTWYHNLWFQVCIPLLIKLKHKMTQTLKNWLFLRLQFVTSYWFSITYAVPVTKQTKIHPGFWPNFRARSSNVKSHHFGSLRNNLIFVLLWLWRIQGWVVSPLVTGTLSLSLTFVPRHEGPCRSFARRLFRSRIKGNVTPSRKHRGAYSFTIPF